MACIENNEKDIPLLETNKTVKDDEEQEKKDLIDKFKTQGNDCYKSKEFEKSIVKYTEALEVCPISFNSERSVLYGNRAAGYYFQ